MGLDIYLEHYLNNQQKLSDIQITIWVTDKLCPLFRSLFYLEPDIWITEDLNNGHLVSIIQTVFYSKGLYSDHDCTIQYSQVYWLQKYGAMTLEVQTLEALTLEVFSKKTLEAPTLEAKWLWRPWHWRPSAEKQLGGEENLCIRGTMGGGGGGRALRGTYVKDV